MTEQRYTLEEAAQILAGEECDMIGHDFHVSTRALRRDPYRVSCHRCRKVWPVGAEE